QDTNTLQSEIVDILATKHRNLMVVGDDAQSIFAWRGANFENIFRFGERYPDANVFRLETNYRSTPEILMLANASVARNRRQFPKNLSAIRPSRDFLPALVPTRDATQQAAFVAARVLEARDEGVPLDEIAVLYRSHFHALELQLELTRRSIPYEVRSGLRFFEQAHIKDVTSYLRLVVNPQDEVAWKRVLKLIPRIGNSSASRIWERLAGAHDPMALVRVEVLEADNFSASLHRGAAKGWRELRELVSELVAPESVDNPSRQIEMILARGYLDYLNAAYENAEARVEDLQQLASFATRFSTTSEFLSELALINTERFAAPGATVGTDIVMGGDEDERLTLSSVHQAKGLEWRVVFLIWAADGRFPSARSLRELEGEEEERRLFYVALTRARDELYVCYPLIESDRGRQTLVQRPSRFVVEVPRSLMEIWSVDEEAASLEQGDSVEPKLLN
ncbi:MAG: ATP-dependent helicase, partial [Acidobacteriota bacterium]